MTERTLIVSPQAGLANRLRAINSALILAEISERRLLHCWHPIRPGHDQVHVNLMQQCGFEEFFLANEYISAASKDGKVDEVISEWGPGDYWFQQQSSGQQYFNAYATSRSANAAARIIHSDATSILLETTLRIWPTDHQGIDIRLPSGVAKQAALDAYKKLCPRSEYLELLQQIPESTIGVHLRVGDLLKYCPEARQNLDEVAAWIHRLASHNQTIAIFADDSSVLRTLKLTPEMSAFNNEVHRHLDDLLPAQKAFASLLYLAHRCHIIYGTPGSSFSQEASLLGGKKYGMVLDG
jgi:hypothetical protein